MGPGVLGLRRRPVGRRHHPGDAVHRGGGRRHEHRDQESARRGHEGAVGRVARLDPRELRSHPRGDDAAVRRRTSRDHGTDQNSGLNVGPAISPDGRWIAFLSSRGLLSIDLYVADAMTGRIVRKLTSPPTPPHPPRTELTYSAATL